MIFSNIIGLILLFLAGGFWFAEACKAMVAGDWIGLVSSAIFGIAIFMMVAIYISLTPP